jgi:hypothetical protein
MTRGAVDGTETFSVILRLMRRIEGIPLYGVGSSKKLETDYKSPINVFRQQTSGNQSPIIFPNVPSAEGRKLWEASTRNEYHELTAM